jgi:hypothetical protein
LPISEDIRDLRIQVNKLSVTVAGGLEQFKVIAQQQQKLLDKLTRVVLDGNGGDSLLTEIALIKENVDRIVKVSTEREAINLKGVWAMRVAVLTSLAAALVAFLK